MTKPRTNKYGYRGYKKIKGYEKKNNCDNHQTK